MKAGFTGTRTGMSEVQKRKLRECLMGAKAFHHGDCKGADEEAHRIAKEMKIWTVGHPPENPKMRAFCDVDECRDPLPFLDRNKRIVDETDYLIAAPKTEQEELRSGTWSTVRYSRKSKKRRIILKP